MSKIMSVNAGSSSLKFKLFEMPSEKVITSGMAERIGLKDGIFSINIDGHKFEQTLNIPDHQVAVELLMDSLLKHKVFKQFHRN